MSPARKSRKKPAPRDLLERLSSLGEAGETGVLQVRPDGWPGGDVYLMGGEIIACGTDRDDEQFGRILISAGAISSGDLEAMRQEVEDDGDLADVLVASGAVSGAQVMESRQILFADNLAWTLSAPDASEEFVASDAVFPTNMQFGLERGAVLEEIRAWRVRVELVLREAIGADQWVTIGEAPEDCDAGLWEGLSEPLTVQEILERAGPPRRKAAERIAGWIATGLLMVDDGAAHLEAIDAEPPPGGEETDYEKAARGEFIKSYDVLDKVDLSGVKVIGAEDGGSPHPSIPSIEALGVEYDDEEVVSRRRSQW